jgi:ribosomal protein S17E
MEKLYPVDQERINYDKTIMSPEFYDSKKVRLRTSGYIMRIMQAVYERLDYECIEVG